MSLDEPTRWALVLRSAARLHGHLAHSGAMPWPAAVALDSQLADEALDAFQFARHVHDELASVGAPAAVLAVARRRFPREDIVSWVWERLAEGLDHGQQDAERHRSVPRA